jgi:hypothetical protein
VEILLLYGADVDIHHPDACDSGLTVDVYEDPEIALFLLDHGVSWGLPGIHDSGMRMHSHKIGGVWDVVLESSQLPLEL